MALYWYAIVDQADKPVQTMRGLEEAEVQLVTYGEIAAVVGTLDEAEVAPTPTNLWRHEAVVECLMGERAVLPMRFGTVFADETRVRASLKAHHSEFVASLRRIRGRVELALQVMWDDDGARSKNSAASVCTKVTKRSLLSRGPILGGRRRAKGTKGNGRAYLMALLEEERRDRAWRQRAETLAERIDARLLALAEDSTRCLLLTPRLLLTAAYLIDKDQVESFRHQVQMLQSEYPEMHFLCTGPWPPYSFVRNGSLVETAREGENDCA